MLPHEVGLAIAEEREWIRPGLRAGDAEVDLLKSGHHLGRAVVIPAMRVVQQHHDGAENLAERRFPVVARRLKHQPPARLQDARDLGAHCHRLACVMQHRPAQCAIRRRISERQRMRPGHIGHQV